MPRPDTTPTETAATTGEPRSIFILNNMSGAHGIQLAGMREKISGTQRPGKCLQLVPGWSLQDPALWAEAKKNEQVVVMLGTRITATAAPEAKTERVGEKMIVEGPVVPTAAPLRDLGIDQALDMIQEIHVLKMLRDLLRDEKREVVAKELRVRLERLEKSGTTRGQLS
jgi:hypothetical protein